VLRGSSLVLMALSWRSLTASCKVRVRVTNRIGVSVTVTFSPANETWTCAAFVCFFKEHHSFSFLDIFVVEDLTLSFSPNVTYIEEPAWALWFVVWEVRYSPRQPWPPLSLVSGHWGAFSPKIEEDIWFRRRLSHHRISLDVLCFLLIALLSWWWIESKGCVVNIGNLLMVLKSTKWFL